MMLHAAPDDACLIYYYSGNVGYRDLAHVLLPNGRLMFFLLSSILNFSHELSTHIYAQFGGSYGHRSKLETSVRDKAEGPDLRPRGKREEMFITQARMAIAESNKHGDHLY